MEQPATSGSSNSGINVTSGYVDVSEGVKLYYEVRRPTSLPTNAKTEKLIMIMGSFGTLKCLEEHADRLVQHFSNSSLTPLEVMTFDSRGMGKSTAPAIRQTTRMLAEDTLFLIDKVWGESSKVHVLGASLGGMIGQELGVLLSKYNRLRSLYLMVISRGAYLRPLALISPSVWLVLLNLFFTEDHEKFVRNYFLPACFGPDTPKDQLEKYVKLWSDNFYDYFGLNNRMACACQMVAVYSHYLTDEGVQVICNSKAPVTCQISLKDKRIAPQQQRELATLLKAKTLVFDQGHLLDDRVTDGLIQSIVNNIESGIAAAKNETN